MTPPHIVRCVLGSCMRLAVWGSVANLGLSLTGQVHGCWATMLVNVSVRTSKTLLASRLNLKETLREAKRAMRQVSRARVPRPGVGHLGPGALCVAVGDDARLAQGVAMCVGVPCDKGHGGVAWASMSAWLLACL